MLKLIILAALTGLAATIPMLVAAFNHHRQRPKTPLDDIRRLARLEAGVFGWRHTLASLRLRASGVPVCVMISQNWAALLEPGLRRLFHLGMRSREALFKRTVVFPVDTSVKAVEHHQGVGEIDTNAWNFEDSGRVQYDRFRRGFKLDLAHHEFAKGVVIERKLMDDNLYPGAGIPRDISSRVEKLATSGAIKREKSAANLLNNAFTGTGTDDEGFTIAGSDGVALCSASHPNGPDGQSGTQSNTGVLTLTQANVQTTALAMRKFTDDTGELVSINPDTLIVPPALMEAATLINETPRAIGSNFNDINIQQGRWNIVVWDYLTDATRWFMVDSVLRDEHLVWYDRVAPEFASTGDFDTLEAKYRAYMRYSRGFDDWRWVFGNDF